MTAPSTVALVLTDVEGSSRLWRDASEAMNAAMSRHHELVADVAAAHGGWRPADQGEGDSTFIAFDTAVAAVAAAVDLQLALAREPWPTPEPLRVRIGIHAGEVITRDGNLFGEAVSRCARIRGIAHGGQTLLSAAAYELVRDRLPIGVSLRSLGEHRMKDLAHPERIWQLDHRDLPSDFPPVTSLATGRHNLPVQLTRFIAREAEVADVVSRLHEGARLVTITGFGGMGKTRLSLAVAAELVSGAPDGVWFVDLSAVTDAEAVPREIGSVLGARDAGQGMTEAVLEQVAAKQLLLVLDNLEQVVDCAPFVSRLLAAAPGVQVLGTSREPLGLRGEVEYRLEPFPTSGSSPTEPASALALFVERARDGRHDFEVGDDGPVIAEICERLDGVPLAIELAAARVALLPPVALLARLRQNLGLLSGTERDRPDRHRTVRAMVQWSFDLLTVQEQALLARMSVFPGTVGLEAVEAICASGPDGTRLDVFSLLASLVDKSLVRRADQDGAARFSLLVSVREFSAEQLAPDEAEALASEHLRYFLSRSVAGAATADSPEEQPWYEEMARDAHSFRWALDYAERSGRGHEHLLLAANLFELWHAGGGREEGRRRLSRARLAVGEVPADPELLAFATSAQAWFSIEDPEGADELARLGLALAESTGDLPVTAFAYQAAGHGSRRQSTRAALERAVELAAAARAAGSPVRWGVTRPDAVEIGAGLLLVLVFERWEDPDGALERARMLHQRAAQTRRVSDLANAEWVMGQLAGDVGDVETATARFQAAEELAGHHVFSRSAGGRLHGSIARVRAGVAPVEDLEMHIARHEDALPFFLALAEVVVGDLRAVAGDLRAAEAAYHRAAARSAAIKSPQWRLARLDRLAGADTRGLLEELYQGSHGEAVVPLPESLGCVVEAAVLAEQYGDLERAARLTATVRGMRGNFLLPEVVLADLEALTARYADEPLRTELPKSLFG